MMHDYPDTMYLIEDLYIRYDPVSSETIKGSASASTVNRTVRRKLTFSKREPPVSHAFTRTDPDAAVITSMRLRTRVKNTR